MIAEDPLRILPETPDIQDLPGRRAAGVEGRLSPRRRTFASVHVLEGAPLPREMRVTDLSADGAFLCLPAEGGPAAFLPKQLPGARLRLRLETPTDPRPVLLTARVVRTMHTGIGVRFEEVSARDRSRLRAYAGFYEMDESIVRVQRALGDLMPGNLLPLGEAAEIEAVLRGAVERGLPLTAILPRRGFRPIPCRAASLEPRDATGDALVLAGLSIPEDVRALYLTFADHPLCYALEGIVLSHGERPVVLVPERIYLTERRTGRRAPVRDAWCELEAPWEPAGRLRLPVLDLGEAGASVRLRPGAALVPGTHLPAFTLQVEGEERRIGGATVRYVAGLDGVEGGSLRAGLRFDEGELDRDAFRELRHRATRNGLGTRLARAASLLGGKVATMLRWSERRMEEGVEVVRYRNRKGSTVAALLDANFDTSDPSIRPDVAVVIAPAILKRKEVFGLLARTILDDLGRDGRKVVVLRFDASYIVGESTMDARLAAEGRPYYNWTFDHLAADIEASLAWVERRFRPARRSLVSLSLSAIPARRVVAEAQGAPVDLWVAPFGCPDAQDVLRNYLAGLDLCDAYRRGEGPETILIHGRPMRGATLYGQAMEGGLAFLDDARRDLSRISVPVVWVLGTYDGWVSHTRVRALLDAPGGGVREVFECATGHMLKSGAEAIELFKLVAESLSKHLFGADRPAREPDLAAYARQSEAEWSRVRRLELADATGFWREHLLGANDGGIGYDVLLDHPEYPRFLARQAELLDPRPGDDVADFGCGTGNLLLSMLDAYPPGTIPGSITWLDLVPEGVDRTGEKILEWFSARGLTPPPCRGVAADLEVSRLIAVSDFLNGTLHGVEGLVDRVEGFSAATARKLVASYGKELHAVLRGAPADAAQVRRLCAELREEEAEVVLELGRAARIVLGKSLPEDARPFHRLRFGAASPKLRLELPDGCFDRIGASLVLPYLWDPLATLREMHRLLRPGGTLVVSSLRPDFDPSKLYTEGVEILKRRGEEGDVAASRHLEALRHFANMVSRLIELEEDGRFRFHDETALTALVSEAGFSRVHAFRAFGAPPVAVIVRAER
ncbi:MAG TPA: methyltransferase domain-containing protein [Thermoanaerobaculia bacterium]|nr:methyltransferase domain-containing protein [Thermoanaerobaculia bacterium]